MGAYNLAYIERVAATTVQKIWRGYEVRWICVPMIYDDTCCELCGCWETVLHSYCFVCESDSQKEEDWRKPCFAFIGEGTLALPLGFFRRRTDIAKWERREEVGRRVQRHVDN